MNLDKQSDSMCCLILRTAKLSLLVILENICQPANVKLLICDYWFVKKYIKKLFLPERPNTVPHDPRQLQQAPGPCLLTHTFWDAFSLFSR